MQSIHQFITQLQSEANNCDYGAMREEMIRNRIVVGVGDNKFREYLIDVEYFDLARCIRKTKQYVSSCTSSQGGVYECRGREFECCQNTAWDQLR